MSQHACELSNTSMNSDWLMLLHRHARSSQTWGRPLAGPMLGIKDLASSQNLFWRAAQICLHRTSATLTWHPRLSLHPHILTMMWVLHMSQLVAKLYCCTVQISKPQMSVLSDCINSSSCVEAGEMRLYDHDSLNTRVALMPMNAVSWPDWFWSFFPCKPFKDLSCCGHSSHLRWEPCITNVWLLQYEDGEMDQDVRDAIRAGDQLGLMETRDADRTMGTYSDDFYETLQPSRTRPTTSFKVHMHWQPICWAPSKQIASSIFQGMAQSYKMRMFCLHFLCRAVKPRDRIQEYIVISSDDSH